MFYIDQLEEKCQTAQRDITTQTRKNIDLKKELKKNQTEVEELRKEVHSCVLVILVNIAVTLQVAELKKLKELR